MEASLGHKKLPLIMFDFDGVLIDTLGLCYGINVLNDPELSVEEYKGFFDGNIYDPHQKDGSPRTRHENFREHYDAGVREIMIPPSLLELTRNLSKQYRLAIVSGTYTKAICEVLERENLLDCFSDILGADVHTSKVVRIKMLLEKYEVLPYETIFLTDTVGDIREAKECGVVSIGVSWGFHEKERLLKTEPFSVVDTVPELSSEIERFFVESAIQ